MSQSAILRRLSEGPATNRELQEACFDHAGGIARDCMALRHQGRIVRIDGKSGRGKEATYALVGELTYVLCPVCQGHQRGPSVCKTCDGYFHVPEKE